jgi:hypothetical protein
MRRYILACAASNVAVDNIVEGLVREGGGKIKVVRRGRTRGLHSSTFRLNTSTFFCGIRRVVSVLQRQLRLIFKVDECEPLGRTLPCPFQLNGQLFCL